LISISLFVVVAKTDIFTEMKKCFSFARSGSSGSSSGGKCCGGAGASSDQHSMNLSMNELKTNILQLFKDIEDAGQRDETLIDYLHNMNISKQQKLKLKEIRNGADDLTLLHVSARHCRQKLCAVLIDEFKLDKDVLSSSKLTPLHILVKNNVMPKLNDNLTPDESFLNKKQKFIDTFNLLMEKNANVNVQDETGFTALHYAVQKANYEAVVLLLKTNCNLNVS
jgi:ankyrin repeat protein